jgi:hypothetical protein
MFKPFPCCISTKGALQITVIEFPKNGVFLLGLQQHWLSKVGAGKVNLAVASITGLRSLLFTCIFPRLHILPYFCCTEAYRIGLRSGDLPSVRKIEGPNHSGDDRSRKELHKEFERLAKFFDCKDKPFSVVLSPALSKLKMRREHDENRMRFVR